jgi:hypothetical protein
MRCREAVFSAIVQSGLLVLFLVVLVIFTRTLWQVFSVHGAHISSWYRWAAMLGMAIILLLVLRRLVDRLRLIREARQEMAELRQQMAQAGIGPDHSSGPPSPPAAPPTNPADTEEPRDRPPPS